VLLLAPAAHAAGSGAARPLCGELLTGYAHCDALARSLPSNIVAEKASASGPPYGPADLQSAYQLADKAAANGAGQTVAVIDAYDDPSAEADLGVYRSHYGLPACTTTNGCFTKVNQSGLTGSTPAPNVSWSGEIALDLDMVSAICPNCKILLVEANSDHLTDLLASVTEAKALGATQISNSWGADEFGGESYFETALSLIGVPITVSSGDSGYGVEYPAASAHVTAVGGTSLKASSNARGWSESAWSGTGSGCSAYIPKPSWQHDVGCARRMVTDVAAVADPYTGVAVYNSYGTSGSHWLQVGGTSAAAPIVAASYALLGGAVTDPSYPYTNPSSFNDVSTGSNGSCTAIYFCTGLVGFDGPTGIGSPNLAGTGDGSTTVTNRSGIVDTSPAPQPVTPVQPKPVSPLLSSVSVSSSPVHLALGGHLSVRIACGTGPACRGLLKLQTKVRGHLRQLGRVHYYVGSGKHRSVTLRLSQANQRFLLQHRALLVYGTAKDSDGTSAQARFRLHAPKQRKSRKHHS
jgi:hypothetical protein